MTGLAKPEDVLTFLKKAHNDFQPLSQQLIFDKTHALHRTSIALYGSILELTGACILLVDCRLVTGVPILLRAILEAYVDLVNLLQNARYGYNMEVSHLKEWLKLLEEAKTGMNEYLADISKAPNLDSTITKWSEEKRKLQAKGYRALKIEEKFKLADMEKEYRSIYNSLCSDAHNNLRALVERHIEREQTDFSMVVYKAYSPEDSAVYVGMSAELLMRATEFIHGFHKSKVQDKLPPYRTELDQLRGEA